MVFAAVLALIGINILTVLVWWQDKCRALAGRWRTPESDLLFLALIGGTPATFFARHRFHHKTRKQPFSTWLMLITITQVCAVIGMTLPALSSRL